MKAHYTPPAEILEKYARVLLHFGLNHTQGIQPGETVELQVPEIAKPLGMALYKQALEAGAHPFFRLMPQGTERIFYDVANESQLHYFPAEYLKAKAELLNHVISVIAEVDPHELDGISPKKIMEAGKARYPYREWLFDKEHRGAFSWTLGLWGTQAKADIVGLTLEEYWHQIITACQLESSDPVATWHEINRKQMIIKQKLNELHIEKVHLEGADMDLWVRIGEKRVWKAGSGANIPSFEHFTSPDWRGTEGWIQFSEPLFRYGSYIEGIRLEFVDGKVSQATATKNENLLKEMIATENADKLGEFSLTDNRFSSITHPMAETLFDENMGGPFGNTHVAVGMAYKDCYEGDSSTVSAEEWDRLGYNNSSVHTDIVSTTDRTVTAFLPDGTQKVIYKKGQFCFEL